MLEIGGAAGDTGLFVRDERVRVRWWKTGGAGLLGWKGAVTRLGAASCRDRPILR
tara:strand:+ start:5094 stop:5258 length:165 start_codon:yes stop_codon:yes gene_type:complete